jgi:hypothetical protein
VVAQQIMAVACGTGSLVTCWQPEAKKKTGWIRISTFSSKVQPSDLTSSHRATPPKVGSQTTNTLPLGDTYYIPPPFTHPNPISLPRLTLTYFTHEMLCEQRLETFSQDYFLWLLLPIVKIATGLRKLWRNMQQAQIQLWCNLNQDYLNRRRPRNETHKYPLVLAADFQADLLLRITAVKGSQCDSWWWLVLQKPSWVMW